MQEWDTDQHIIVLTILYETASLTEFVFHRWIQSTPTYMSMPSLLFLHFYPSMAICCFTKPPKGRCLDTAFEPNSFASLLSWSFVDYRVEFWRPWVQ